MDMHGRTAFITGGGSGIGLALAEALARRQARIAVFDLKFSDTARVRLRQACPEVLFFEIDVRDAAGMDAAVRTAVTQIGVPDVAINSAGVQVALPFLEISSERYDFVVDINLKGSRNFAAAVLPHMTGGSHLAFLASMAGLVSNYGYAAYSSSKFGVVGLANALRIECRTRGVSVSVICPPEVETAMVEDERRTAPAVTMHAKRFAGTVTLDDLCTQVLRGMERDEFMIVPGGWRARFTVLLGRVFPKLLARMTDRMIAKGLQSGGQA
ncbi:MAG: SDR family NAD(P)-dependent oxidoreductase [Steroidobacteraceae bacterium]